jgi:hypothetical protein
MTEAPETPGSPPVEPGGQAAQPPTSPSSGAVTPRDEATVAEYPVVLDAQRQDEYSRFMPLVKWLLAIPHYIALAILGIAAAVCVIISFFAVLFTRRYPEGLFNFVVGVARWAWRVGAYVLLLVDRYPPFSLAEDPDYPARFNIEYPAEGIARWRPLVQWLLAIPYLIVARLLQYLALLLAFFALFTILFTRKFPDGMFKIVLVAFRWQARGNAYAGFMVPKYPPWVWG